MRTMQSELVEKKLATNDPPPPKKKPKEDFSRRDIEELMGVHRPTYTRKHGAIRSK